MAFYDIIGHSDTVAQLKKKIKDNRIHHAMMFYGPQGIGKRTLAKEFIKAVNCKNFNDDSCESCNNCKWINNNSHPDIIIITNEIRAESLDIPLLYRDNLSEDNASKEDRSASKKEISIEQIRYIEKVIYTRPIEAKYRVIFIIDAETLNKNSANALLKTLEEPPENTIIIMTTSYLGMIPATIRSRAEKIRVKPLTNDEICQLLNKKLGISSNELDILLHLLKGSLNKKILSVNDESLMEYINLIGYLVNSENISVSEIIDICNTLTLTPDRSEKELRIYIFFTILKEFLVDVYLNRKSEMWNKYLKYDTSLDFDLLDNISETIKFLKWSQNMYCNQNIAIKSELLRLVEQWNRLSV